MMLVARAVKIKSRDIIGAARRVRARLLFEKDSDSGASGVPPVSVADFLTLAVRFVTVCVYIDGQGLIQVDILTEGTLMRFC
jgi:hypothetical protein